MPLNAHVVPFKISLSEILNGAEEDRTPDPLHAMQVLSQLSYSPLKIYLLTFAILEYKMLGVDLKISAEVVEWHTRRSQKPMGATP